MASDGERELVRAQRKLETATTKCEAAQLERDRVIDRVTRRGGGVTWERAMEIAHFKGRESIRDARARVEAAEHTQG